MRKDYFNDPDAPKANAAVPSVTAIVVDDGRLLLVHRADNDLWALPGGGHEVGESIEDTVVREVKEETGMDVQVTGLVGLYTNPAHVMAYDDGEVRQQFSLCFRARVLGGPACQQSGIQGGALGPDRGSRCPEHPPVDAPAHPARPRPRAPGAVSRLT